MLTGVMTNDYHHLRGEGGGVFIKELHDSHACNDCNGSTICIIMNRKLQPDSNVLRIHILHVMKASHASTVTVDTDKYRLVGIPPSCHEPPDVGLT